jgi:hypothetical protein
MNGPKGSLPYPKLSCAADATDMGGFTPAHYAVRYGYDNIVEYRKHRRFFLDQYMRGLLLTHKVLLFTSFQMTCQIIPIKAAKKAASGRLERM